MQNAKVHYADSGLHKIRGLIELPPIDVAGKLNEDKAVKLFQKKYGYNTIVTGIEYSSELRRMTIEDFIVNSEKVNEEEN